MDYYSKQELLSALGRPVKVEINITNDEGDEILNDTHEISVDSVEEFGDAIESHLDNLRSDLYLMFEDLQNETND